MPSRYMTVRRVLLDIAAWLDIMAVLKRENNMINIYELFGDSDDELDPQHLRPLREFIVLESERRFWEDKAKYDNTSMAIQTQLVEITTECMSVRLNVLDNSSPEVRNTACVILLELS